jgi:TolA-binding protein
MKDSPEDLSARSRRVTLGETDERRLGLALESSHESRLLHQAGLDFDAEDAVLPGDEAVADRVAKRVLTQVRAVRELRRSKPAGRRRLSRWAFAAAAALLSAIATAGTMIAVRHFETTAGYREWLEAPAEKTPVVKAPLPLETAVRAEPPPSSVPSVAVEAAVPTPAPTPKSKAERPTSAENAAELFASASLARREGGSAAAIALYDSLQSRYPNSPEARAADLPLGMLHLQRGQARQALVHFQRLRQKNPRGQMASEALWGEAQALSSLGRSADAARAYAEIAEKYPASPYAAAARSKLEASRSKP